MSWPYLSKVKSGPVPREGRPSPEKSINLPKNKLGLLRSCQIAYGAFGVNR